MAVNCLAHMHVERAARSLPEELNKLSVPLGIWYVSMSSKFDGKQLKFE